MACSKAHFLSNGISWFFQFFLDGAETTDHDVLADPGFLGSHLDLAIITARGNHFIFELICL